MPSNVFEEIHESQGPVEDNNIIPAQDAFNELPDEVVLEILKKVKTPKELLLQWGTVSSKLRKLVFDRAVWEKFVPPPINQNQYSPKVYHFFARAFYSSFYQKIIQEGMADPEYFDWELRRWSEPGKNGFPKCDSSAGNLPLLLGCENAQEYLKDKLRNGRYGLNSQHLQAVLEYGDEKLLGELLSIHIDNPEKYEEIQRGFFCVAAEGDKLTRLKTIWKKASLIQQQKMLEESDFADAFYLALCGAAENGHLRIVQWLWRHAAEHHKTDPDIFLRTLFAGHMHIVEWVWEQLAENTKAACIKEIDTTVYLGNLNKLKWFWANTSTEQQDEKIFNDNGFTVAAESGNFQLLEWLWMHATEEQQARILATELDTAFEGAVGRNLQMVEWLWSLATREQQDQIRANTFPKAFQCAASNGDLDLLEWLWALATREQRVAMLEADNHRAFYLTVEKRHLEIVKWLWKKATPEQRPAMLAAPENGYAAFFTDNPPILTWLWKHATEEQRTFLWENGGVPSKFFLATKCLQILEWGWKHSTQGQQFEILKSIFHFMDNKTDDLQKCWEQVTKKQNTIVLESINRLAFYRAAEGNFQLLECLWGGLSQKQRSEMLKSNSDFYRLAALEDISPRLGDFLEAQSNLEDNTDFIANFREFVTSDFRTASNASEHESRLCFLSNAPREQQSRPFIETIEIVKSDSVNIIDLSEQQDDSKRKPESESKNTFGV